MPPNPPTKAHGFAMRSMSLRDMQIYKSEKKKYWPPPPAKSWGRPWRGPCLHVLALFLLFLLTGVLFLYVGGLFLGLPLYNFFFAAPMPVL